MPQHASQLTWGALKEFAESHGIKDEANINLEVEIKGLQPALRASGWANGMQVAPDSGYTITVRCSI